MPYAGGRRYGAFNAVAEFADWRAPVRGDDGNQRAERILDGSAD